MKVCYFINMLDQITLIVRSESEEGCLYSFIENEYSHPRPVNQRCLQLNKRTPYKDLPTKSGLKVARLLGIIKTSQS